MPKNPFGKSRTQDKPYAIYKNDSGWEWRILKTYKLAKNEDNYSRWFVAATSPHMHDGGFELGDDYAVNIRQSGTLVQADDGWLDAYPDDATPKALSHQAGHTEDPTVIWF